MKSAITRLILAVACGILFVSPVVYADEKIRDPNPINLLNENVFWETRKPAGVYKGAVVAFTPEADNGPYVQISIGVKPDVSGSLLSDFQSIIKVTVEQEGTEVEFKLLPTTCTNFEDQGVQYWYIQLMAQRWMFEGTWTFVLHYDGVDGQKHKQVKSFVTDATNPIGFSTPLSNIKFEKSSDGDYLVSWNTIGDPTISYPNKESNPDKAMRRFDYRVSVYDEDGVCPFSQRGVWTLPPGSLPSPIHTGYFNPVTQRVTFHISPEYAGRKVRVESWFFGSSIPGRLTARSVHTNMLDY